MATSVSAPTAGRAPYRWLVGVVLVPSIVVAALLGGLYLVAMPLWPVVGHYYFSQQQATYAALRVPLLVHISAGMVALGTGSVNLVTAARGRRLRRHAWIGRVYAVAVVVAAGASVFLAFQAYPGTLPAGRLIVTSGFLVLAIARVGCLTLGVRAMVVHRDMARHRFWMIATFSLNFAAVALRLENAVLLLTGTFELLYPLLAWASWVPTLAIGMGLARRRAPVSAAASPRD